MKILITGGNGQLGCSLRKVLVGFPAVEAVFTDMPGADITDAACMQNLILEHRPEVIVNCAAYTAVDRAESEPELCARINVEGPRILAALAKTNDIALIHISTDYVFDGESCRPLHEDYPTNPTGVYGKTKLAGEKAVAESGCRAAIIRTAWLYSEFGANFVKTMLRLGTERNELRVVYDQVGTPTYAPDLAEAIVYLAQRGIQGCETYHFSNEGVISWYDFAQFIFKRQHLDIKLHPIESSAYPTPAKRPSYSVLSKEKIKSTGVAVPYWLDSLTLCLDALNKNNN